jgi:hypothetical protein
MRNREDAFQHVVEALFIQKILQKVIGNTQSDRPSCVGKTFIAAEYDNGNIAIFSSHLLDEFKTVHYRHGDVRENQVGRDGEEHLKALLPIRSHSAHGKLRAIPKFHPKDPVDCSFFILDD